MIVCLSASDLMNVYINNVPFKSRDDIKTSFFFFFYGKRKMSADQKVKKENKNWKNTVFGPPTTTRKFQG